MGRRKIPQTTQEFQAELEYSKEQLRMAENQQKRLKNKIRTEQEKLRTRRLCQEAGILEHHIPELKDMTDEERAGLLEASATSEPAKAYLGQWHEGKRENVVSEETK